MDTKVARANQKCTLKQENNNNNNKNNMYA